MIRYKTAQNLEELHQILALQKNNVPEILSEQEKESQGFVTVRHTIGILERMNAKCPHIIAKTDTEVIGYALCMHPDFEEEIPILQPMFSEIRTRLKTPLSFIIMGQICIDKRYRGQGVFRKLYRKMKEVATPEFDVVITEIDVRNTRSMEAHTAIGFKTLGTYQADNRTWALVVLE